MAEKDKGGGGQGGSTSSASEIQAWVAANYTATTVGSSTVPRPMPIIPSGSWLRRSA